MYAISRAIIDGQEMMSKIFKIKAMNEFNAEEARKVYNESKLTNLANILEELKNVAMNGYNQLYVYHHLSINEIEQLEEKGFKVYNHPSIDIQRDNLYYTISF